MRLLIDTNIFLEVILGQEKAQVAQQLLSQTEEHDFFISDYSLHSIGLLLVRRKQYDVFRQFVADMMSNAGVTLIGLSVDGMEAVMDAAEKYRLDFDDAYQYAIAERYGLTLVSFDADFDRTERGRLDPDQLRS